MLARADAPPRKRAPERTCAGCREVLPQAQLVRLVLGPDGHVVPDLAGRAFGRGAWIHPAQRCIERAAPRGLAKSFRAEVKTSAAELHAAILAAAARRAESLLLAAERGGHLAVGATEVTEALAAGRALRVVVARDARAAAELGSVRKAIADGLAVAFGDKELLGQLTRRSETGVVAVVDRGLCDALTRVFDMMSIPEPNTGTRAAGAREDG